MWTEKQRPVVNEMLACLVKSGFRTCTIKKILKAIDDERVWNENEEIRRLQNVADVISKTAR